MSADTLHPIEKALTGEPSPDDILDAVDEAIEHAWLHADDATLIALADLLDDAAAERRGIGAASASRLCALAS